MKKLYFSIFLLAGIVTANAQSSVSGLDNPIQVKHKITKGVQPFATDTMWPPSFSPNALMCDTALVYYKLSAPNTGYAFGNNSIGETECAQKYYGSGSVTKVLLLYGKKIGSAGSTTAKIYGIDAAKKGPNATVMGTSAAVTISAMPSTGFVDYTFGTPVSVTTSFAAAVVFPTTSGDSVAVASTKLGCATTDSLSWINIAGTWMSINDAFGSNAELCIFPVVNTTGSVNEFPSSNGLTLLGSFPNPAVDQAVVKYELAQNTSVAVLVFDQSGKIVMSQPAQSMSAGIHNLKIDASQLASGTYYYSIKTNETMLTSEFSVVK